MNDSITCEYVSTPEPISLLTIRSGLKFEIKTGMSMNRNLFSAAKQITGQRTRKRCLEVIEEIIKENQKTS